MPGDEINIVNGRVFVNDNPEPLRYDFVQGEVFGNFGPYFVPENSYFVLGDNRGNSVDSRHWNTPFVYQGQILGRVVFRYFPGIQNLANT